MSNGISGELITLDDRHRIFIAYSHKQRPLVQELYDLLCKNGKAVFYDMKIKAGAIWRQMSLTAEQRGLKRQPAG